VSFKVEGGVSSGFSWVPLLPLLWWPPLPPPWFGCCFQTA